ncbi:MAG: hypothetical protein HKO66_07345 [Saprospiraceae bacterium]|nr:hypothetical protein [Bacteroidia bacterium]NNL92028.1 hypothetical protein [Saprospiraceae bacterium]
MKQSIVILLIFLICKSTFGMGVVVAFNSMDCQSETTATKDAQVDSECADIQNDTEQDDDCCNGGSCDCLCCGHIFVNKNFSDLKFDQNPLTYKHIYNYKNEYAFNASAFIWQPPRNI